MPRRASVFVKESVILFGFLSGVWVAVGVNPGARLLGVFLEVVGDMTRGSPLDMLRTLLPFALLAFFLWLVVRIYKRGRWLGIAAVLCAFVAGAQIVADPFASLVLLGAALALGYVAAK